METRAAAMVSRATPKCKSCSRSPRHISSLQPDTAAHGLMMPAVSMYCSCVRSVARQPAVGWKSPNCQTCRLGPAFLVNLHAQSRSQMKDFK
eukprot:11417542-Alexandrium_andersonii.AAC.1